MDEYDAPQPVVVIENRSNMSPEMQSQQWLKLFYEKVLVM